MVADAPQVLLMLITTLTAQTSHPIVSTLVALAQSRLTRWFTLAECQQYLHLDECPPEP